MKQKFEKGLALILMLCMIVLSIPVMEVSAASTTQLNADIVLNKNEMYEDETFTVKVSLNGLPYDEKEEPNDVILVLDKSGSMRSDFENLRNAAKKFVNEVLTKKDRAHRIGIVAFGDDAETCEITTDLAELVTFLDSLVCDGGSTQTGTGIEAAMKLLQKKRSNATGAIVLMTDGMNSDGDVAYEKAEKAKKTRYVFYTVAFCNQNTEADKVLRKMATSETDHYSVFYSVQLSSVYDSISTKIGSVNPRDIVVTQVINEPFELVDGSTANNIPLPQIKGNTLVWSMNQLGGSLELPYEIKLKDGSSVGTYTVGTGYVQYTDHNGGTQLLHMPEYSIEVKTREPIITSITPNSVLSGNADAMTITGNYFKTGAEVYVGTTKVSNPVVVDENTINFVMPDYPMGTVSVRVVNPDGKQASSTITVQSNIQITNIQANNCIEGESPIITITGTGFYGKVKTIKVMVGTKYATIKSVTGSTQITCQLPSSLTAGVYDVVVMNASNKGTVTEVGGFTVNPKSIPVIEIDSVSPSVYVENTKNTITIIGKGFYKAANSLKIKVGDKFATVNTSVKTDDGCIITCTVPSSLSEGTHDVTVTNKQGTVIATKSQAYIRHPSLVPVPEISEVIPAAISSTNDVVTINGTGFTDKISLVKVELVNTVTGVTKYATVDSASKTQFLIRIPSSLPAGRYDVRVINYGGVVLEKSDALEINW